jgi:hypothetical protein
MPAPSPQQVRALVSRLSQKRNEKPLVVGIESPAGWSGPAELEVEGEKYTVVEANSPLAIRERLLTAETAGQRLVLLTSLQTQNLGDDLLGRLCKAKLIPLSARESLKDIFQAQSVHPFILATRWFAETLLECVPSEGVLPAPSGFLDLDTAWGLVLRAKLGISQSHPDSQDLLAWSAEDGHRIAWQNCRTELKAAAREWISQTAGAAGLSIVDCIEAGHGTEAVALGLAFHVVLAPDAQKTASLRDAAVRLERFTANRPISQASAEAWKRASTDYVESLNRQVRDAAARECLQQSDELLRQVQVESFAYLSNYSPAGFEQRLERCAQNILAALENGSPKNLKELTDRVDLADDHYLASNASPRVDRLRMALRLTRWLATHKAHATGSFDQMALEYSDEISFVDWARYSLYTGESIPSLGQAYARLLEVVGAAREELNHLFAQAVVPWSPTAGSGVIPGENILREVVAPAAKIQPVLLVVLDGMSLAVFRELSVDLSAHGWVMANFEGQTKIHAAAAPLPTVTEHARRSLLCGRIDSEIGEVAGFAANPDLVEVSARTHPPRLFLKGDLMDPAEGGLSKELRDEIGSAKRRVVGVVVNAVDDLLTKGDQISLPWKLDHLHVLAQLLDAAQAAGRLIVLTSDHGHVLEYQGKMRAGGESDRYRCTGGAPTEGELEVFGPRVGNFAGGRFIAPWSERIYYTSRKAGYHGGLTPQEVMVPVAVFGREEFNLKGLVAAPAIQPSWWTEESVPAGSAEPLAVASASAKLERDLPLFVAAESRAQASARDWIEHLLKSEVYQRQASLMGRAALSADLLRAILNALQDRGDRMLKPALAQRIGQPEFRLPGVIASLRRVMNVDGYPVITFEEASGTVCLNRQLLKTQFEIE